MFLLVERKSRKDIHRKLPKLFYDFGFFFFFHNEKRDERTCDMPHWRYSDPQFPLTAFKTVRKLKGSTFPN